MPFSANSVRHLRRTLIGLACGATLVALAWQIENIRGQRAWNAALKTYADRGDPLDALPSPESVPPEKNFLQTPLLIPILLGKYDSPEVIAFRSREPFFEFAPSASAQWDDGESLNLSLLARDIARHRDKKKLPELSGLKDADLVLAQFEIENSALAELRDAALHRPLARVVRPGPPPQIGQLLKLDFPSFSVPRHFVRQLTFQSSALLANSRPELAYPSTLASIQFTNGLGDQPYTLMEVMISAALVRMAIQPVWEGLRLHAWTDGQLTRFSTLFSEIDLMSSLAQTIRNERNNAMHMPLSDLSAPEFVKQFGPYQLMPEGWWLQNKIQMVKMNDLPLAATASHTQPTFRVNLSKLGHRPHGKTLSPYKFFAEAFAISYEKLVANTARSASAITLALTACALERHYLAHGAYPESLDKLVPAYLTTVPLDIINGDPLRYRLNPDGTFTLYSIGLDGDDDNGHRTPSGSNDLTTDGDWAW